MVAFGEARDKIVVQYTGKKNYNVNINLWNDMSNRKGIYTEDGTKLTVISTYDELDSIDNLSEEDLSALKQSGDPASAPTKSSLILLVSFLGFQEHPV